MPTTPTHTNADLEMARKILDFLKRPVINDEAIATMLAEHNEGRDQRVKELESALLLILSEEPELFEDGLAADLNEEGITKITDAYSSGLNDGLDHCKIIARKAFPKGTK